MSEEQKKDEEKKEIEMNEQIKEIASKIRKEAGLDDLAAQIDAISKKQFPALTPKMQQIFNGKDLSKPAELTKEEKIVGFYHALVTRDHAVLKALSEGTAADGGYLFPDEFYAELVKEMTATWHLRNLVRTVTMNRDIMKIPTVVSKPKVYWTAENATKTTTSAEFYEATLTAYKMAAIIYASDELVEDSIYFDVVQLIISLFADAIAEEEDKVIAAGTGTGQPTGLTTAITATTIPNVTCSGNLSFDNIINLVYALPSQYRRNASFLVANANISELRKLKDSQNRYLWEESPQQGEPARILGYPVYEVNYLGDAVIVFGDWKQCYWFGLRKGMTVKVSQETETAFTKDQTAIRVVERIAGNVVLGTAARALVSIP